MSNSIKAPSPFGQIRIFALAIGMHYLFWMIVFQVARILFFAYHTEKLADLGYTDLVHAFRAGLPMDISASTYLLALPLMILFIGLWVDIQKASKFILKYYTLVSLVLVAAITFTDVEIYANWGYKANAEVISYLAHPKEAMASSESSPIVSLTLGLILFTVVFWWGYRKYALPYMSIPTTSGSLWSYSCRIVIMLVALGLAIIAIRGGIGLSNMGPGHAYHSQHQIMNHGATNASWNFLYSIQKTSSESPCEYHFMNDEVAEPIRSQILYQDATADTVDIFNTKTPNVVLVVLEGWPVDVTASFGGEAGITPFFDSIALEGIRFTNVYASGDRTFKGVPGVLSGFPAFPSGSIIQYIQKMEQLPCIASSMKSKQYDTHFIYGGDIEFKSISSFITHCGYDHILSQTDFAPKLAAGSKWGVHDHDVFSRAAKEIDKLQKPFFSTILTLSSHEPYDVPISTQFPGQDVSDQFRNSVYYADWSIRQFFEEIRDADWFDNTVFVFTSDHGKPLPIKREAWQHETFHIPALIYGQPLKLEYRGSTIDKIGSQLDIVKTLMNQIDIPSTEYKWSRNLLNPSTVPFAFYSFESGVGTVTPDGNIIYDRVSGRLINQDQNTITDLQEEQLEALKAYLQSLCTHFDTL